MPFTLCSLNTTVGSELQSSYLFSQGQREQSSCRKLLIDGCARGAVDPHEER